LDLVSVGPATLEDFELLGIKTVGQIIAIREFEAIDGRALTRRVRVLIGKPELFPDGPGYYCPFQISGAGSEEIKYAVGMDSVQALQLAMVWQW
jgi:hypothetical protein